MGVTPAELSELQELKAVRDGLDAQIGSLRASNSATALGLPARCGRLRPLTQLWLASRIDHSPGTMAHVNRDRELFARAATLRAERRTRVAGGEDDELVCAEQKAKLYEEQLALDTQALETTERVNARWSNRLNPFYTPRQPQTAPNLAAILFRDVFAQDFDERFLSFLAARASVPAEFSVANIGIQLCITRIIVPRLANLAWNNPATTVKLVLYLAGAILEGIMPAATMWSTANLLNLVENSLAGRPVSWDLALRAGGLTSALFVLQLCMFDVMQHTSTYLNHVVTTAVERVYIAAKLDLAQHPDPDPVQCSVVTAASIVSGHQYSKFRSLSSSPWALVRAISEVVTSALNAGSQIALLASFLKNGAQRGNGIAGILNWNNGIIITILVTPTIISLLHNWAYNRFRGSTASSKKIKERMLRVTVDTLVENEEARNELVLFGLRDWTLKAWDRLQESVGRTLRPNESGASLSLRMFRIGADELAKNAFYMVLATHTIQTSLSLGTIHLCQALGQDIKSILDTLIDRVCAAYQVPFLLAGLFSAADGPETIRVLEDFEAHRVPGGMRIEARGLTYTYGSGKQILRGIDLVVEPGESLAVVGLNGSGKTTLVKTLLGLNNHEGEVLVNGRSITEYTPESVHARMSCLFQNYGKYDISLRDNVGLGDTTRITDDSAITLAIDRAGAGAMRDELGLDVWLVAHLPSATFKKFSHLLKPLTPLEDAEVPSPKMAVEEPKTEVEGTAEGETEEATNMTESDEEPETASEEDSFTGGLSGGQWQRIALARAFMRAGSADLIVFDEPSASLDPRAEAELFESIHALSHTGTGATTLFITHRMNTVRRADKIAFMEKGRIVEYGSFAQLMELRGKFYECFDLQRRGFFEDGNATSIPASTDKAKEEKEKETK